jgi:hypothetical protein
MEEINDPFYCGEFVTPVTPEPKRKQWRFKSREEFEKESGRFRGRGWNGSGQMDYLLGRFVKDWIREDSKIRTGFDPYDPNWSIEEDFEVYYQDRRSYDYWYCEASDLVFD